MLVDYRVRFLRKPDEGKKGAAPSHPDQTSTSVITVSDPLTATLEEEDLKVVSGLPSSMHGRFDNDFVVMDNQEEGRPGKDVCYVYDDNTLLAIVWIE
uniref:Spindlin-Z-like n=1 Tax=Haemonchus contortus TaxID=6289 RepID=A0A7I5E792_HAECO